jgi:molybdenum storage protein
MSPKDSAKHIWERFQHESLTSKDLLTATDRKPIRIIPGVKIIKIGGQSITDRGRAALYPILDEIVANRKRGKKIMLFSGGGTRARHAYQVALDLELPPGFLAAVGGPIGMQNARILQMLLAKHGGIYIIAEQFEMLPMFFKLGCIPIMIGMPPYSYWEEVPKKGSIPDNRTDSGTFLTGEFLGAESILYIKDENGLYTEDPKKNPKAEFIPEIGVDELLEMDLGDLVVERVVLEYLQRAKNIKYLEIVNGMVPGNITKALNGKHAGTRIYKKMP